jgi:mRNA degradation ribonuclease J1/J2
VAAKEVGDPTILKQHVRRTLGKYFFEVIQRKPIIVPVIMEI